MHAKLILEDGTSYEGESFGATADTIGEVVFNTSLTGYQEIATDPSYRFQIVVMTYPHIGNYGVENVVEQSEAPQVAGFVVRDAIDEPSNAHAQMSLGDYFTRTGITPAASVAQRDGAVGKGVPASSGKASASANRMRNMAVMIPAAIIR
ncbi:MAG TPA: carbamoyl-phosphate synthase domain-containing protein, partial [Thermoanaerobaculia bacterium]|nr:carbamoyl-phosphate synthase domain-containing protein [Thermoanaerobaculia bacterium]